MSQLLSIWPISPIIEPTEKRTHFQIVMDYTGDTRHEFDAGDALAQD